MLLVQIVSWLVLGSSGEGSPVLDYQRMQDLKALLAARIVEIEVVLQVGGDQDPSLATKLIGQGVCLKDRDGRTLLLTSEFLVEGAASIEARTAAYPDPVPVHVERRSRALGVVFLGPEGGGEANPATPSSPLAGLGVLPPGGGDETGDQHSRSFPWGGCGIEVVLAPAVEAQPGAQVFSIDNPLALPNIFWGALDGHAEAPLSRFLLTLTGMPLGYPLFTADGRLAALNLRPYTTQSSLFLAVSAPQLRSELALERPPEHEVGRHQRRDADQR